MTPVSWKNLVIRLKEFGFVGPIQQGKHPFMVRGALKITIPNPHEGDIGAGLLMNILRQAEISRKEWMTENSSKK